MLSHEEAVADETVGRTSLHSADATIVAPVVVAPAVVDGAEDKVVAVLAQPWLKTKAFVSAPEKTHMVFQDDLNPGNLAAEGKRFDAKLAPTDQEVIGAARLMSRRGTVDELLFIIDKNSGADKWLYERVKKLTHKPAKLAYLQDLISIESLLELS